MSSTSINTGSNKQNILKYLNISKNEVTTKEIAIIRLDLEMYKISDNDLLDQEDFEILAGESSSFSVPGTFEIEFPEKGETLNIFLPYNINLIKTENFSSSSKELVITYEPGDVIFNAYIKKVETNIDILNSLFENRIKYLRGHIGKQLEAVWSQLNSTTNYRSHHLQLILAQLYARRIDGEDVQIRHTPNQDYKKSDAINTKESSHLFNLGAQSFNYGYTNDALIASVFKDRKNKLTFDQTHPDELNSILTQNDIKKIMSPSALGYRLDDDMQKIKPGMVEHYTDLENIIAGRYDELVNKKNNL